MHVIDIKSNVKDYSVTIGQLSNYLHELLALDHKMFVVDNRVYELYKDSVLKDLPKNLLMLISAEEDNKTLNGVQEVYDFLLQSPAKRNLTLITIGGGILQDITGFVASSLYRGINWILIPTTLLAQADSCIGSKTSLNYKGYKNLIGSFYPPSKVWIDPSFVDTLTEEDFYSGIGEIIKLHIMGGQAPLIDLATSFRLLSKRDTSTIERLIFSSLRIKLSYMEGDEYDLGRRNLLNYGHCVGHAIESITNYRIPHGQAIIIGMIIANQISVARGLLSQDKCDLLEKTYLLPALKTHLLSEEYKPDQIIDAMGKDKKRTGKGLVVIMIDNNDELIRVNDLNAEEVIHAVNNKINLIS